MNTENAVFIHNDYSGIKETNPALCNKIGLRWHYVKGEQAQEDKDCTISLRGLLKPWA